MSGTQREQYIALGIIIPRGHENYGKVQETRTRNLKLRLIKKGIITPKYPRFYH